MYEQILKFTKMYLFWKICVWDKIVNEDIYCARLAQLSTTFLFTKFAFLKIICLNKFWNWHKCIYFEKMRLRENCWVRDLLCLSSKTRHNFSFHEIRIFENWMFKQILKVTNVYLFWKGCVWEIIVRKKICCAYLAKLSITFLFTIFAFLKIVCLNKFGNLQKCIYFEKDATERKLLRERFIVLA